MNYNEREKLLRKNSIPLTQCSCSYCGESGFIMNKEDGFYCVFCESYPSSIRFNMSVIPNGRAYLRSVNE